MTTDGTLESLRMLERRRLRADVARQMRSKPTMPMAEVFAGLEVAIVGTMPQDNAIAAVKFDVLLQAFAHLQELDRKMDPSRWSEDEMAAWARRELLATDAFRILRDAD